MSFGLGNRGSDAYQGPVTYGHGGDHILVFMAAFVDSFPTGHSLQVLITINILIFSSGFLQM